MRSVLVLSVACSGPTTTRSAAPVNRGGAPCFPDREAIHANDVVHALRPYLHENGNAPVPFGNCTFKDGMLVAVDGTEVVEEDACELGVRVEKIRDRFGAEVGMLGRDVLARRQGDSFLCENRNYIETICVFYVHGAREATQYVVAESLNADGIGGDDAVAFFSPREIARIVIRTCET